MVCRAAEIAATNAELVQVGSADSSSVPVAYPAMRIRSIDAVLTDVPVHIVKPERIRGEGANHSMEHVSVVERHRVAPVGEEALGGRVAEVCLAFEVLR